MASASSVLIVVLHFVLLHSEKLPVCSAGIGTVSCRVSVNLSDEVIAAHESCHEKHHKEREEGKDKEKGKKPPKPMHKIDSLEDFDFDDHCQSHCVFETIGIISGDQTLPDKKQTGKFFEPAKISKENFAKMTTLWDSCVDKVEKISKAKGLDKCKTASLMEFCFFREMRDSEKSLQIDC